MPADRRPASFNRWPLFLLALAGFFLLLTSWSVYRAARDGSAPLSRRGTLPAGAAAMPLTR